MRTTPLYFPPQKISTGKKNTQWYKECVDGAESLAILRTDGALNHHYKMQVWENLDNDIIDENEIEKVFNPMQISNGIFPAAIKNYPLSVPKIDLLQGEEIKRKFDFKLLARNEDAYSTQSKFKKEQIMQTAMQEIQSQSFDEKDFQAKMQEMEKYFKYEYKDLNELSATRVLEYLWREQDMKLKFSYGFRDAIVKGREIYRIDDIGGEPGVVKCDPKNTYFLRRGESHRIEDSDIIVEISYAPVGKVIDEFHSDLTPSQIEQLEAGIQRLKQNSGGVLSHQNAFPILMGGTQIGGTVGGDNGFNAVGVFNLPFDYEGNVRICRVRWIGRRKIGIVTFFNPVTGDQEERYESEYYKIKEELGESIKWIWVNESYEGTRLAEDIYVRMQPRKVQMRHFDNPSRCFLGYVGTDYGKSIMARMEPYQYLYNVYMRRLELAIAKYKGPIYELDTSSKPDDWDVQMWMYYADVLGWSIKDSFNEGKKGQATGKIAGNLNNQTKVLDANAGNYIQQLVMMLQYIEKQMGQIAGVNEQRQGQIDNRETVGGVERAVTQSSHITEKWFFVHEETKKRVLLALLDTAKQIWKNKKSKKISYIMDDMSRITMDINGQDFASTELDLFISDSSDDMKIRQTLESLAQAYIQNGGSMTLPIKVLRSDSITQMAKLIEAEEDSIRQRQSEMEEKRIEADTAMKQAEMQERQAEREFQYWKVEKESEVKLQIAGMQPTEDTTIDQEKVNLDRQKLDNDKVVKDRELALKQEQLAEAKRHNIKAEEISKIKKQAPTKSK